MLFLAQQDRCREWARRLSELLSLSLSHGAALQCFSAHAQTDCERATASLSSRTNINRRTLSLPLHAVPRLAETKVSFEQLKKKKDFLNGLWAVKMSEQGLCRCHRSQTCDVLFAGCSLVSRSLRLPHASCTAAVRYRMKSIFMLSYCLVKSSQYTPSTITIITTVALSENYIYPSPYVPTDSVEDIFVPSCLTLWVQTTSKCKSFKLRVSLATSVATLNECFVFFPLHVLAWVTTVEYII